jgi:hypothetical protein
MIDLNRIPARHDAINLRLEEWARWVRVSPQRWACQPMFRGYQSKARHWEISPEIKMALNTIAAHEIEKVVSMLPDKHRTALRWHYVWPNLHINAVQRNLGVTQEALLALINDGRDMVIDRLKQKMVDVG